MWFFWKLFSVIGSLHCECIIPVFTCCLYVLEKINKNVGQFIQSVSNFLNCVFAPVSNFNHRPPTHTLICASVPIQTCLGTMIIDPFIHVFPPVSKLLLYRLVFHLFEEHDNTRVDWFLQVSHKFQHRDWFVEVFPSCVKFYHM